MNSISKHLAEHKGKCIDAFQRIEFIDEYTALKMMKDYFPKYNKYSNVYLMIRDYSDYVNDKACACFALPMSSLKQHLCPDDGSKRFYYDLIEVFADTKGHKILIGINYEHYEEILESFEKAVDFAVSVETSFFCYSEESLIDIDYKPKDKNQRIFIVKNNEILNAKIVWCEIDYDNLTAKSLSRTIDISKDISDKIICLLHNGLPLEPYKHRDWICDDRWFGKGIFRIILHTTEMIPSCDNEWDLSDKIYFEKGKKPEQKELAELIDYLYENMTDSERILFPYIV